MISERSGIIDRLKSGTTTINDFNYDKLAAPPLSMLLNQYDIDRLYNIATSVRYAGNTKKKYKAIDEILLPRDFSKLSAGTNRLCYKFQHDDGFVIKVAYDSIAIQDSPAEFTNQYTLKPFCTKVFEVDPCGVVGSFERVDPITSREEFVSVADDVYYLIDNWLLYNGHIMADIGTKYFMNYGLRRGFGVVVIDFPYLYEIDGNKIFCTSPDNKSNTGVCGGVIDFDPGFNELYCKKCGTRYRVKEISKDIEEGKILVKGNERRKEKMKIKITVGGVDITKGDNRIDGFGPEATKATVPNNIKGKVAVKTVPRGNNKHYTYNNSGQGRTVTVPNTRTNDNQKQRNGYTKPCGSSTGSVKITNGGSQSEKPSRPLPERNNRQEKTTAAESRGKTAVTMIPTDYDVLKSVNTEVAQKPEKEKSPSEIIDSISEKLEAAEKAEYCWKKESEKYKEMAENATLELEQTKADLEAAEKAEYYWKGELEQTKVALESAQTTNESIKESYDSLLKNYTELLDINKSLEDTLQSKNDTIDSINVNIKASMHEIDDLQAEIKRLSESEVDLERYISIEEFEARMDKANSQHESEMAANNTALTEMNNVVNCISDDLVEFCKFSIDSDNFFLTPYMEPDAYFSPEAIDGASNVNACIIKISDFRDLNDGEDDIYVLAFMHGKDYLSTTDGKYVIASTIGGVSVNSLVINGFEDIMSEDLFDKYFADTQEKEENTEEAENSEEENQPLEHVEGEVMSDGAKTDNIGED